MFVESQNLVTAEAFRKDFDRYIDEGAAMVAITRDSQVVGVFLSPAEYEAQFGAAVQKLLKSREKGPTVDHATVRKRAEQVIRRQRKS